MKILTESETETRYITGRISKINEKAFFFIIKNEESGQMVEGYKAELQWQNLYENEFKKAGKRKGRSKFSLKFN